MAFFWEGEVHLSRGEIVVRERRWATTDGDGFDVVVV